MWNTTINTNKFTYNQITATFVANLSDLTEYDIGRGHLVLKSQVTGRTVKFKYDGNYISPSGIRSIDYVSRCGNYRVSIKK